jgi:hypothetical protein
LIGVVAGMLANAHGRGLYHCDLNASHVLLRNWKEGAAEAFLIHFENSKIRKRVEMGERVRDLGRLERSASHFLPARTRLRFLRRYLKASGGGDLGEWAGAVRRDAARRAR